MQFQNKIELKYAIVICVQSTAFANGQTDKNSVNQNLKIIDLLFTVLFFNAKSNWKNITKLFIEIFSLKKFKMFKLSEYLP